MLKAIALLERALELLVFFFHAAAHYSGAHIGQQLLVVPRLLDEVGGAFLHGADGIVERAVGGDHNDGKLGITRAYVTQDFQAIAVRQSEVEQYQVKGPLTQAGQAVFTGFCRFHTVAFEFEQGLQRLADASFIVNNQDGTAVAGVSPWAS